MTPRSANPRQPGSAQSGPSVPRRLLLFALALTLPILAFAGFLLWQFATAERDRMEMVATATARRIAGAVDRELSGLVSALNVLASSPFLRANDFEGFYRQAAEVRDRTGYWVVLRDPRTRQQFVNTRVPRGMPLPQSNVPEPSEEALRSRRVTVSGLYTGAIVKAPLFAVQAPLGREGGQGPYVLSLSVPVEVIRDVIAAEDLPASWTASVVDGSGAILARNRRHEEFVGQQATKDLLDNTRGQEGSWRGLTLDGFPVLGAYARSRLSDWRVAVGVREDELNAPLRRSLWLFAGLGAALGILATGLALGVGRGIAAPIQALAGQAAALGRGEPVAPLATSLSEANRVSIALAAASAGLREREQALRESEARHRQIVESSTDYAIITTDLDGQITGWNAGARHLLGWREAEALGQNRRLIYTPEDREAGAPEAKMQLALAKGRAADERWHVRKDGSRFWSSGALLPLRDDAGATIGFLKILRDRTTEREAEDALRRLNATLEERVARRTSDLTAANERLEAAAADRERVEEQLRQAQKMEAVGQLTGGVAHDFNNLLTVVVGNLEMLQRRLTEADPRVRRGIENAMAGAARAAALTHRLLAFSRQQPLDPKPTDVNKLVAGMSDLLRRTLGEHIAIETVLAGGLWRANVDANQLENAILNLAVNARDAMPEGGKLTVETGNAYLDEAYAALRPEVTPGRYVMVAVCDTGAGMPAEVAARAFEPFFTTKAVGQGTGLGLSQVYGFVKQSGGHVAIYSEPSEGTTVKLYLPRLNSVAEAPAEPAEPEPLAVSARRETILVVEDEEMVRRFSVEALEEAGYRVLESGDGPTGLALLRAHSEVALLFTDVVLAGPMNGRALADEASRLRPDLTVLFTTGYTRNAIIHHGRLDEGVNFIGKPFTVRALASKVRELLNARPAS